MMQNISAWMDIQSLLMTVLSALTIVTTIVMGLLIYTYPYSYSGDFLYFDGDTPNFFLNT